MPDLSSLQSQAAQLRSSADQSRLAFNAADAALAEAQANFTTAQRTGGDVAALKAQVDRAAQARTAAMARRDLAVAALGNQLASLVGQIGPEAPLAGLDPLVPLVLLPVRLETRFNPNLTTELMVRIIPDDIHGDSHEPELSSTEVEAGRNFWVKAWRAGTVEPAATTGEQNAWAELVGAVGTTRAAWVAKALTPTNPGDRSAQPTAVGTPFSVDPVFPTPALRGGTWTRAPWTTALPDRWVVLAYSGGKRIATVWGGPVPDHVHMGPDPAATPAPDGSAGAGTGVDSGLAWVVDFSAAESIGLGIRVPVPAQGGLDRIFAFGVRASLEPASSAARLASLIDAHHYTGGCAIVPQGTPTNNTPSDRAGWTSRPTAASSFRVERRPKQLPASSNGGLIAAALGIDPASFSSVDHALDTEQSAAASMATLLWGPTMGYFLEQMLQYQGPNASQIAMVRRHFIDYVRGRGPLPALRIGNQPYGILPVTSLQRWKAFDEDPVTTNIVPILRAAQPFWAVGATSVPRLGGSGDLDQDFVHALTLCARSTLLQVRTVQSTTFCRETQPLLGAAAKDPCAAAEAIADAAWAAFDLRGGLLGHGYHPRVADVVFSEDAATLRLPFINGDPGPSSYLQTLRTASLTQISSDATHASTSTSVLATLARHAVLLAYGAAADQLGSRALTGTSGSPPVPPFAVRPEAEMFGVSAQVAAANPRFEAATISPTTQQLFSPVANVTGTATAAEYLRLGVDKWRVGVVDPFVDPSLFEIDNALADLANRPIDELEGLLSETLDVVSHRLDAWITSLATRRLHALRAQRPSAVYLGGFGWIEGLARRPSDPQAAVPPGETGPLVADTEGGGYIHAPSLTQAATGAVLRSANISHANTTSASDGALGIDLSSRRVYLAMELIDGVRAGQPLGALLGYRLERALHDDFASLELDRYIAPLRAIAPLVANAVTPPSPGQSVEVLAARNVVDGLVLAKMDPGQIRIKLAAAVTTPPAKPAELDAVLGEVASISDAVDGLSDLLLSESVYHIIQGNPTRAGMTVDALNRGSILPEAEVVRTNISGAGITHRVMVLLPRTSDAVAGWSTVGPRGAAEARLDAWAGRLLGDPARVRLRIAYDDAKGKTTIVETQLSTVLASDAALAAIDVVYDANASGNGTSTFEQRIANRAAISPLPGAPAAFTTVRPVRGRDSAWPSTALSIDEFLTLAASLRAVVVGGRYLTGVDLGRPEDKPQPAVDTAELGARATAAANALEIALTKLNGLLDPVPSTDAVALLEAVELLSAFGMLPPGLGSSSRDLPTVLGQARALAAIASSRRAAVGKLQALPRPPVDPSDAYDLAILAVVFGEDFRILPVCRPDNAAVLGAGFAANPSLLNGDAGKAWEWLRRVSTVRPSPGRLAEAMLFAQALGTGEESDLRVTQVPLVAGARWAGLPQPPPSTPTTTFVAHCSAALHPSDGLSGLFLDEWTEVVPASTQTTGIAFQAGTPRAQAPQAILLAVSPDPGKPWDLNAIEAVLTETFALTQQRMVDLDTLTWAGHFLPATYIADSAFNSTPSIHWKDIVTNATKAFQTAQVTGGGS
jgi:hypothetical protein